MPYPAIDGGRIRVLNLIRGICQIHKVTLLTLIASPTDEQGANHLHKMGMEVIGVRWKRSLLKSLTQRKPLTVAKYYSVDMAKALEGLLKSRKFDIVHFEMLHAGQYWKPHMQEVKTVLGEQNIDSNIWYRLARTERNLLKKLIFYWQYRSFARYESRICRYFDICICVSAEDQKKLASISPRTAMEVVPNGVDIDYFKPGEMADYAANLSEVEYAAGLFEKDEIRLIFTGSMDWHPNEDAVLYFCDRIFPLIRAELPGVKFYIVGSNPTDRVLKLRRIQGVIVTGSVEDVRPYIAAATVYIVPLRVGGGTRLKILQALAMEKAVISTSVGCEGLDLQPGKHLLIADKPWQFAAGTVQLIRDRSLRRELSENGRALVLERYDWNVVVKKLDDVYSKLIGS